MNKEKCTCYYNSDFGYILASYAVQEGSVLKRVIDPVIVLDANTTSKELNEKIIDALQKSQISNPVKFSEIKDFKFWSVSKIKGFASFSKKFQSVSIEKKGNDYELQNMDRDEQGAYEYSKSNLIRVSNSEELGKNLIEILCEKLEGTEKVNYSFETLNQNIVEYTIPSDGFLDIGDGHTDAYQVFVYEEDEKNYIAFLIDQKYEDFSEAKVKHKWEEMYEKVQNFQYQEIDKSSLKKMVKAKTKNANIVSYFYEDGESLLEVMTAVNILNVTKDKQEKIENEIRSVIDSIRVGEK